MSFTAHRRAFMRNSPIVSSAVLALAALVLAGISFGPGTVRAAAGDWKLIGTSDESSLVYNQGLASDRGGNLRGRGYATIRPEAAMDGWTHIGDGDLSRGRMYDAYESLDSGRKMFTITDPDGRFHRYYHRLIPGEKANNSFVTVDPSGKFLVSGEWATQQRLLVFADPVGRRDGAQLPLAGVIALDKPMTDVQSCDFMTATELVCASDKPDKAVYTISLARALGPSPSTTGTVRREFAVPRLSACRGSYEIEGIDYDVARHVLSVAMIDPSPCLLNTKVFRYRHLVRR
ncbi:MAG: hypothetical protein QM658_12185 [Gordonia sp. (in: high G+C Gram-positive bacteria)]